MKRPTKAGVWYRSDGDWQILVALQYQDVGPPVLNYQHVRDKDRGGSVSSLPEEGWQMSFEILLNYPPGNTNNKVIAQALLTAYNLKLIEFEGIKNICKALGPSWVAITADEPEKG